MHASAAVPQPTSYLDYLVHYALATPDADAVWFEGVTLSYRELAARVDELAAALTSLGAGPGVRVATLCTPRPEYLISLLATMRTGAVWIGLNPKYTLSELRHVATDSRPALFLSLDAVDGREYGDDVTALAIEVGALGAYRIGPRTRASALLDLPDPDFIPRPDSYPALRATDPATIVYTSGSSGAPKGAVLSHGGLVYAARVEADVLGIRAPRVPCNLPINHVACLADLTGTTLAAGGMLALLEQFDPASLLALVPELGLTNLMTVPTILQLIAAQPEFTDTDLSTLKRVVWGGAPLPFDVIRAYRARGIPLMTVYGMTETIASITFTRDGDSDEVLAETVGRFDPGMEVRLADERGPVKQGEQGEVQVRHSGLFLEYFGNPTGTAGAYTDDGWFKTGDVGVLNADGTLRLVGRMSDMIKSGGYNVYPREIELRLETRDDVSLAAVIGRPDDTFGEVGVAYVVPAAGRQPDAAALRAYAKEHLANYKVPKEIVIVDALPLLPVGKVDKQQLRRLARA